MRFGKAADGKRPGKGARAGQPGPLRWRRALPVLLSAMLLSVVLPLGATDIPDVMPPSSLYGVNDDLVAFQQEKASRYDPPEVLRETRNVLDLIQPRRIDKTGPLTNYTLVTPEIPDLAEPYIFDEAHNMSALNGTSIIEFLLNQPLSYFVYTNHNGVRTWSKGFLRPVLDLNLSSPGLLTPDPWVPVDADGDPATGDGGYEIQARIGFVFENLSFKLPSLSPVPPFRVPGSLDFSGGLRFEVEKRAATTTRLPMEVAFLKAFMYRGLNYVWMVSFNFSDVPQQFAASALAEKFHATGDLLDMALNVISGILGIGNGTQIVDVAGPYRVQISTSPLESLVAMVGYAKAESYRLVERSWIVATLAPGAGSSALPGLMEVWLDSPSFTSSFNELRWTSSGRVRLDAELVENHENTTYGLIRVHDLPDFLELRLDNLSTDGSPNGYIHFESSESIGFIGYDEYELFGGNAAEYKHLHVAISGLPTGITLTGTFDVARASPGAVGNPGSGIVARILDNVMVRLAGKFATIARTLRSIPDNLLNMPSRAGWTSLDLPDGQEIGEIEMWLASGPFVLRDGSFLAFYNQTLPASDRPLVNVSFSARLSGIRGLSADFRRGNHIDLRASVRQRFTAVFVDDSRGSNASLELFPLPSRLVLDVDKENRSLSLSMSDKVLWFDYIGWEGRQYLKLSLQDLPTVFSVVQKPDRFYMSAAEGQTVGRLEIQSTDSDLYALEGNYLLTRSGPDGTMFGASLGGLSSVGYSTGQNGKLELALSSPDPLQVYIENSSENLRARLLVTPLPTRIAIGMSDLLTGGLKVPDLMNATSLFGFSSAVFAITRLGADVLGIASQVAGVVDAQMSSIGQNSTFSVDTASDTTLVGDIQKGNLTEAPWTHGVSSRHVPVPGGKGFYYNTKIYLRLARQTTISSRTDGDSMNVSVEMKGFHPRYDWMLLDLEGIGGRDLFAYLTGMPSSFDLRLEANITQNTTYGRETVSADLRFSSSQPLGQFLASIGRLAPQNTRVMLFASSLASELGLNAFLAGRFDLRYRASEPIEYLYIKSSRLLDGKWRATTALLHDIPRTLDVSMAPREEFDAGAGPSQMLPELSVAADAGTLDMFVDLDGRATGQRSSYQVEMKDAGELVTAQNLDGVYRLRSSGTDEIYLRLRDMPYMRGMAISAMGLFMENLRSLDLSISMVFGVYPVFRISSLEADSVHLSVDASLDLGGPKHASIVLADFRSTGGLPAGVGMFQNGLVSGVSRNDDHLIVPMPIATLVWTLLGG